MCTFTKAGPEDDWIAKTLKDGGEGYNDKATALKDQKKKAEEDGTEPPVLAEFGPPFSHQYCNFVKAAIQHKGTANLQFNKSWVVDWEEIAKKNGITDVDSCAIFQRKALKNGAEVARCSSPSMRRTSTS